MVLKQHPRRVALAGVGAVLVVVAVVVILLVTGSGSSSLPGQNGKPAAATPSQIQQLAGKLGHPIYWLGPQAGVTYEVTHLSAGDDTYVRYLTGGAKPGTPSAGYATVGTYLRGSALSGLLVVARQPHHRRFKLAGGALAVTAKGSHSVYMAYPRSNYQIEIYAPTPGEALSIVRSGQVQPMG